MRLVVLKSYIAFVLILSFPSLLKAQDDYRFRNFTTNDGLSQNSVNCIMQDKEGFLWLGTQDGLCRYDGYGFKQFRANRKDAYAMSDNFVLSFAEDENGYLWFTTRNGLNRMNKQTGKCNKFFLDTASHRNQFGNVAIDHKGMVWISHGSGTYNIDSKRKYNASIIQIPESKRTSNISTYDISVLPDGTVVLQTEFALRLISENGEQKMELEDYQSMGNSTGDAIVKDRKGTIWNATTNGLFHVPKGSKNLKSFSLKIGKQPVCNSLEIANNGEVWVGTTTGLFIVHDDNSVSHITNNPQDESSLAYNLIHAVYKDRSGLMWVGTANKGLNLYDASRNQFKVLNNHNAGGALNDNLIWSVCQSGPKSLVIGTNYGLNHVLLNNENITAGEFGSSNIDTIENWSTRFPELKDTRISALLCDQEQQIWVGTHQKGLWKINRNKDSILKINIPETYSNQVITDLLQDKQGDIWVASYYGVFRIKLDGIIDSFWDINNESSNEYGLITNYYLAVFEDTDGIIWLGSNAGISKYIAAENQFSNYPYNENTPEKSIAFQFAVDFYDDGKGSLWIATFGGGLSRLDKASETFTHYRSEDGLASEVLAGIMGDRNGNIWLSHNHGISQFNPQTKQFINFDKGDGVIFNEFALNSFYQNESGELFFGCPKGLVVFHPDSITTNTNLPAVQITGMKVNYKDISAAVNKEIYNRYKLEKVLHLDRKHKVIAFEFTALDFRNPDKQKFRYRMKGFDANWVETTSNNRLATYSSLPPGEYVFEVEASNDNGIWSNKIQAIKVVVYPPFWQTWWFILSVVLFLLVTIVVVVRYYAQRKLRKRLQLIQTQRKIQDERDRISRDLHDNVGSQITYMISSLDNLSYQLEKKGESNESGSVDELSDFARDTMQQLRETIWVLNKDAVSLEELHQKITEFVSKMMAVLPNMASQINVEGNGAQMLHPSLAIHLFRIVQEAVNNTIKHAAAEEIAIALSLTKTQLDVLISDNGNGFDTQQEKAGHFGLSNMKQRIKEMGGTFEITSDTEKGTAIKIAVPVT
jgi:signal transduction histidine kinase/ligand-binding sensor domain-containing protein